MADELRTCQEVKVKYEAVIDEVMENKNSYDTENLNAKDMSDTWNV